MGRTAPPQTSDTVLPGRLAELLADHGEAGLTEALDLVVAELGLRSVVLRDAVAETPPTPAPPPRSAPRRRRRGRARRTDHARGDLGRCHRQHRRAADPRGRPGR